MEVGLKKNILKDCFTKKNVHFCPFCPSKYYVETLFAKITAVCFFGMFLTALHIWKLVILNFLEKYLDFSQTG